MRYTLSDDTWDKQEQFAIERVINSGMFTMGDEVRLFESEFAKFFGSNYAIMVNSGSSANLLSIAALIYSGKLKKGDEVIVPAVSWSTTYYPLHQYGLKLVFVDIDLDTLNLKIDSVVNALSSNTKAIFAVNLLGNSNDYGKLGEICNEYNLLLIEDNCESLGAKFSGKFCGTHGILGTFSTFYSHHICTMEGGVIVTDDEILYHYMLSLRAHGWTRNIPENSMLYKKTTNDFYESFNFILPGYNLRPLEIEAAIGREQLVKIPKIINQRRENAKIFKELFLHKDNLRIQKETGESSWFGFSMILENDLRDRRDEVVRVLNENNIDVRPIVAGNFTRNKVINYMDYSISDNLINADIIHDNGLFVGNHSKNIHKELKVLSDLFDSCF